MKKIKKNLPIYSIYVPVVSVHFGGGVGIEIAMCDNGNVKYLIWCELYIHTCI